MPTHRDTRAVSGLGKELKALRDTTGLGQIAFAERIDVDQSSLVRWEKEQRAIPVSALLKLAEVAPQDEKQFWLKKAGIALPESKAKMRRPSARTVFAQVPLVSNPAGAGRGFLHDSEEIEGELRLPRDLVTEKMACIRISGSSMEPVIPNKSIVAIDGRQIDPRRLIGSIVAVQHNIEGVIVKRLLQHEGALVLVSENPLFAPIIFDPRIWRVAGKAAWWIVKES